MCHEAWSWHKGISNESNMQEIALAPNTPRSLITTAFYLCGTRWIVWVRYSHEVIWTVFSTIFERKLRKLQVNVAAWCYSNRPDAVQVTWVVEWIVRTREVSLKISQIVCTRPWHLSCTCRHRIVCLIYLSFLSHNNDRFPTPPNLIIKSNYHSNRSAVLLILLMFSRGSHTALSFTVNSVKFAILCFLSEPLRATRWVKHSKTAFLSDGLVSVPKSLSKVYTLRRNFKEHIVPCKLFSWFPKRLNIG